MTVFDKYFPIGLGTARFPINGPNDEAGIEKSVRLVLKALDLGINYIDTSHIYSGGMAQTVLKQAFAQTKRQYAVTLKINYWLDKTADAAWRRAESALKIMGISRAAFFVAWSIKSYEEFREITKKGGVYDCALKMREEKLIDHICFSTHAPIPEMIQIIESGAFEGVTVSCSLLNGVAMQPVLEAARKHNLGVAVMNPLGGGIIPQNTDVFSFARNDDDQSTVQAALRYITAQPAVQIVISGCETEREIEENVANLKLPDAEPGQERIARVNKDIAGLEGFCTGCGYCDSCPKGIPIPAIMQSRNTLLFTPPADYNRTELEQLKNITLFRKLHFDFQLGMEQMENPCIHCRQCEKKCTQRLKICDALEDTYNRAKRTGYLEEAAKERLQTLLAGMRYQKVGFYPNGGYADYVLKKYKQFFGQPEWEILMFNSNPKTWNTRSGGFMVHAPDEIPSLHPDAIIVCTYRYDTEIFNALAQYAEQGIEIVKLHHADDIPWVF